MKREGGREAGYCSKMLSDRGDRCLLTIYNDLDKKYDIQSSQLGNKHLFFP